MDAVRFAMSPKFAHSELSRNIYVRCQRDDRLRLPSQTANMASEAHTFGENLRAARIALGWSQEKLADAAETSKGYISDLERNKRPMPPGKKLDALASALGVPLTQLVQDEVEPRPSERTVPLVGYVGAGALAHFYAGGDQGLDLVPAPKDYTDHTVAAEIRGESLGPVLEGWLVYWDEVRNPVTPDLYGVLCVVGLPNDQVLVKQIRPAAEPNHFHLISNSNEAPMFDKEVLWAARVTSMTPR